MKSGMRIRKRGGHKGFLAGTVLSIVPVLVMLFTVHLANAADMDLDDQTGTKGSDVVFTLSVNNAPNSVGSLRVDVGFDPAVLEYGDADFSGTLLDPFALEGVSSPYPGVLLLGAFTPEPEKYFPAGTSGVMARFTFTVIGEQDSLLTLGELTDDVAGWSTRDGQFTFIPFSFSIEPSSVEMCAGASVAFRIVPEEIGTPPFTWQVDGVEAQSGDARTFEYRTREPGEHVIRVEDATGQGAQAVAVVKEQDDTGSLDIPGKSVRSGTTVTIPVRVQDAPNPVSALGFDVLFDPDLLIFENHYFTGTRLDDFDFKEVTELSPGHLRIGGFTSENPIAAGSTDSVVSLTFRVTCEDCTSTGMELANLKDHLASWRASGNCIPACCRCNGDINADTEITPLDALCAFEKFLLVCPTTAGISCDEVCCDVTNDWECTPVDALCIFQKYLELPCCLD